MKWRDVQFDWNRARAFLVTAEEGSLSAAAKALNMTQPTLGRQVSALEEELGVPLFERVGRGLRLTPNGTDLLVHVRAMAEAAGRLSLAATGRAESIAGSICITATEAASAYLLPPVIRRLREVHPGIEVELVASNATTDLKRREADIAVRAFRPTQPDLIARKLTDGNAYLYATAGYLKSLGNLQSPSDLSKADFIGFGDNEQYLNALNALGLELTKDHFPIVTESHLVHWELVKQGAGIGVMTETVGDAEPQVRRALSSIPPLPYELWLVAHRELRTSRRVRAVFDVLVEELTSVLTRPS